MFHGMVKGDKPIQWVIGMGSDHIGMGSMKCSNPSVFLLDANLSSGTQREHCSTLDPKHGLFEIFDRFGHDTLGQCIVLMRCSFGCDSEDSDEMTDVVDSAGMTEADATNDAGLNADAGQCLMRQEWRTLKRRTAARDVGTTPDVIFEFDGGVVDAYSTLTL